MPSIDERIVSMAFENQVFEQRVAQTMATLSKLDTAIKNAGGTSGLENIEKSANKVTLQGPMSALDKLKAKLGGASQGAAEGLGGIDAAGNKVTLEGPSRAVDKLQGKMGQLSAGTTFTDIERSADQVTLGGLTRAIDSVSGKFSVLQGAASVALGNITSQAVMRGGAFAKSFAFGPLQQGFSEYQTNLNAIQTILANTQGQQVTGLSNTNKYLGQLNTYSDKTIYNFGEMAKNIGTFTAAGVDLPKSVESIKGIANLAALSGSNSQQASTAMYQLSQAIAAGRVGLQDWNSVVNAGMGGAVFQKALMRTAETMGTVEKGAVQIDKATGKATVNGESFRESIMAKPGEQSWLTSDVLTKTLGQFTGDLSNAELKAQGFSAAQIKAIQAQAKMAQHAATEVKTLPQVFDIARETIGSGWSKTFQTIFGDFGESKKTFTELSNTINGFINTNANARNKVLADWKKLGGRKELIEGIKSGFEALLAVIKPIKDAFRDIFPAQTGKSLFEFTKSFRDFMENLKPGSEVIDGIKRTARGFFAVLHIGFGIIKEVVRVIGDLLTSAGEGSGGFLAFTGGIGDFLVALDKSLTQGGKLKDFFDGLGDILQKPAQLLGKFGRTLGGLFDSTDGSALAQLNGQLRRVGEQVVPTSKAVGNLRDAWDKLVGAFGKAKTALEPWFAKFVEGMRGFGDLVSNALSGIDFDNVMSGLQAGFLGGIFVVIKKALGGGGVLGELKSVLGGVNGLIGGFTGQMEAMQTKLKADSLLAVGAAILLLAGGIFILSQIDGKNLSRSLAAVAVGLAELSGAMKFLLAGTGKLGPLNLAFLAVGFIGLAFAIILLAGAMKIFATMSWEDLAKGIAGVAGAIAAIGTSMKLVPATLPVTAAGLILIGIALLLIGSALKIFASLSWEELVKGLLGVVEALRGIAIGVSMMPPTLPLTAAGLILVGVALNLIGAAVAMMGSLDFATLIKGLGGVTAALIGIGIAMWLMPPNMIVMGAGLIAVGVALNFIGTALAIMGNIGIFDLIKGLVALGATLVILAVGLTLMSATGPGAVALLAAAAALAVLAPTLAFLGTLAWGTIFKGLAAIALVLGTLAVVGAIAGPALFQLGIALIPLAVGFLIAGAAVYLFAKGLALLAGEGKKGVAVLITAIATFIAALPALVLGLIKSMLDIVDEVVKLAPRVVTALSKVLETVIAFIIANAPKLALAIGALIDAVILVTATNAPKLIAAGFTLLNNLLTGISQNIGPIVDKVSTIITNFLNALTANAPRLVAAGTRTLVAFLTGIANAMPRLVAKVTDIITKFLGALAVAYPRIIAAGTTIVVKFIEGIGQSVARIISAGVRFIESIMTGIGNAIPRLVAKGLWVAGRFLNGLADGMSGLANAGFRAIIRFLNGIERAIRENFDELFSAGEGIADAIIDGLVAQLGKLGGKVKAAANKVVGILPGAAKKLLGIGSPSKVFNEIGMNTMRGLVRGIDAGGKQAVSSVESLANNLLSSAQGRPFGSYPYILEGIIDTEPVITPVLDLTDVRTELKKMQDWSSVVPINAMTSFTTSAILVQEQQPQTATRPSSSDEGVVLNFQQNNSSPRSLSNIEIYRQTRNILATAKMSLETI